MSSSPFRGQGNRAPAVGRLCGPCRPRIHLRPWTLIVRLSDALSGSEETLRLPHALDPGRLRTWTMITTQNLNCYLEFVSSFGLTFIVADYSDSFGHKHHNTGAVAVWLFWPTGSTGSDAISDCLQLEG